MNPARFGKLFPLGSHLCREPMPPMSELKRDMENLKRHGFNLVKLQEQWAVDEPLEGRCDFSRYEELIAHAARLDLGVYLGLTCEQAPAWLWRKFPDCAMVGRDGARLAYIAPGPLPADGKPGPCYDHAGARMAQNRFIETLVRTLGCYENIVVWNTWQEIGYWSEGIVGQPVCYCPHTLDAFRRWLAGKYGDLDGLNRAWNTRYLDWSYVLPDQSIACPAHPLEIDWRHFQDNARIARVLAERAAVVRAADPLRRPVFAHKGAPSVGSGADWTYARCQDFLGSSTYPAWAPFDRWDDGRPAPGRPHDRHAALTAEMWRGCALQYDYIRSCNPPGQPVWAAEFQGGPVSTSFHKGRVPSAADLRRWMLTAAASGVTALSFWVTRAEIMAAELNGFSLLDSAGDTTERFEEASRVGRALNRHADLFARPTGPQAEVGILIDEANFQVCASMRAADHLAYSVRGWHRLLWDLGVTADFVEVSDDRAQTSGYRALILPFPLSISEQAAARLAAYARAGGHLISEACPGRVTEHGYANRGELSPALRALFGVAQAGLCMVSEPDGGSRWMPAERTWGEFLEPAMLEGAGPLKGRQARANLYLQTFACAGSRPILTHAGAPAGTVRRAGRGKAWLLGTFLGHAGTAYRNPETAAFVGALLAECGVAPARAGALLVRKRAAAGGGKQAWFFTNPTVDQVVATIEVPGWPKVEDLLGGRVGRRGDAVELAVDALDVRVLIVSR
jgi:beta-galactosidase